MKKILLLSTLLLGAVALTNAQSSCATALPITTNGTITAPAVTGTYSDVCYTNTTTNTGGDLAAIWYSYTPLTSGEVTITSVLPVNVAPNSVDTKVSVFTGTCAALACYVANDDTSATEYLSTITFPVAAGTTYYIAWDNFWDANGFNFSFNFTSISCVKPYYVNASTNLTTTSATLNWVNSVSAPANYEIEYGAPGFVTGAGTTVTSSTNSVTLSSLTPSGVFDYYIRSSCGFGNFSSWSGPYSLVLLKAFPYATGFDNNTDLAGWVTSGSSATFGLGNTAVNAQSPGQYFIFNNSAAAAVNNWLISPAFTMAAGETVTWTFYVRTLANANRSFKLTVGTDQTVAAQTTTIWSNTTLTSNPNYTQITAPVFTAPAAGVYYFGWNDFSPAGGAVVGTMRFDTVAATSTLSVNDYLSGKFSVSPNPSNEYVSISNNANINMQAITISDMNGRTVKTSEFGGNISDAKINISSLSPGIYLLNIKSDMGNAVKKIVKK